MKMSLNAQYKGRIPDRYFEQRYADAEYTDAGELKVPGRYLVKEEEIDEELGFGPWNPFTIYIARCWDCDNYCICRHQWADDQDFLSYEIDRWWSTLSYENDLREQLRLLGFERSAQVIAEPLQPSNRLPIDHLPAYMASTEQMVDNARNELVRHHLHHEKVGAVFGQLNADILKWVCLLSPFWIRRPAETGKRTSDLLDHLFGQYDVPECLKSAVNERLTRYELKWLLWYIIIGSGGSLAKIGRSLDWNIPKKMASALFDVPGYTSMRVANLYAFMLSKGGKARDFQRICENRFFVIDPTEPFSSEIEKKFWDDTITWMIANGDELTDEDAEMTLAWVVHQFTENRRGQQLFRWNGRAVGPTLRKSRAYRAEIRSKTDLKIWEAKGWNWTHQDEYARLVTVTELTSSDKLYQEGVQMRHCVNLYTGRCVWGHSAIFSFAMNGIKELTLEVDPRTLQLVQARGLQNRMATPAESEIIKLWMAEKVDPDRNN